MCVCVQVDLTTEFCFLPFSSSYSHLSFLLLFFQIKMSHVKYKEKYRLNILNTENKQNLKKKKTQHISHYNK